MSNKKKLGYNLKEKIIKKINQKGGWVNTHAHFDRAYTLSKKNFHLGTIYFQKKWQLNTEIIKKSTVNDIYDRMSQAIETMISQNVQAVGTFIDVDPNAKDKGIKAAIKVREKYKKDIKIKYINQTLHGVINKDAYLWFKTASQFVDIIGGLPSKDKGQEHKHLDIILSTGKQLNKMVHVHVDQNNDPKEKETELLVKKTKEHRMENKVVAIHALSLSAQKKQYRKKIYKRMKKAGIMVIANPTAYIDSSRNEIKVPFHNAVTPVDEMVPARLTVALGTDNINDLHKPFTDGDMWTELRFLLESCRYYNIDQLVKIATINGLKVLGM